MTRRAEDGLAGDDMIAFGPVPSRRLGRSLGINHIPPKWCTYSCVYCQVGQTTRMQTDRCAFYDPAEIERAVRGKLRSVRKAGERVDFLSLVPDGEPTLDIELGQEITRLRSLGSRIAVITNGSLIWREDVRADLMQADWVSLKVDAVREELWRTANRPYRGLRLASILDGMRQFAHEYQGELVTETMLIAGVNDGDAHLAETTDFLAGLRPAVAYLAVPIWPPASHWVRVPDEGTINRAYQMLSRSCERVELLTGYEGDAFACTGDVEADLLSITAVHPMRQDAVDAFLRRAGADWSVVQRLIAQGELVESEYQERRFYTRRLFR